MESNKTDCGKCGMLVSTQLMSRHQKRSLCGNILEMEKWNSRKEKLHCSICDFKFKTKMQFKSHIIDKHQSAKKQKQFYCSICEFNDKKQENLKVHLWKEHSITISVRPPKSAYMCTFCDFVSSVKRDYEHIKGISIIKDSCVRNVIIKQKLGVV